MVIHPSSVVADDARFGDGSSIGPFCVLGVDGEPDADGLQVGDHAIIRSHVVMYRGTRVGDGFHAGHGALVREHTVIGDRVSVGSHSIVEHHVRLADGVRLHSGCFVPEYSVLEEGAWLGPGVVVTNSRYPGEVDAKDKLEGVTIERDVVVGAAVVLLPGIRLGAGALIGAGAVVVRDIPPGVTVVGNPGRILRA